MTTYSYTLTIQIKYKFVMNEMRVNDSDTSMR